MSAATIDHHHTVVSAAGPSPEDPRLFASLFGVIGQIHHLGTAATTAPSTSPMPSTAMMSSCSHSHSTTAAMTAFPADWHISTLPLQSESSGPTTTNQHVFPSQVVGAGSISSSTCATKDVLTFEKTIMKTGSATQYARRFTAASEAEMATDESQTLAMTLPSHCGRHGITTIVTGTGIAAADDVARNHEGDVTDGKTTTRVDMSKNAKDISSTIQKLLSKHGSKGDDVMMTGIIGTSVASPPTFSFREVDSTTFAATNNANSDFNRSHEQDALCLKLFLHTNSKIDQNHAQQDTDSLEAHQQQLHQHDHDLHEAVRPSSHNLMHYDAFLGNTSTLSFPHDKDVVSVNWQHHTDHGDEKNLINLNEQNCDNRPLAVAEGITIDQNVRNSCRDAVLVKPSVHMSMQSGFDQSLQSDYDHDCAENEDARKHHMLSREEKRLPQAENECKMMTDMHMDWDPTPNSVMGSVPKTTGGPGGFMKVFKTAFNQTDNVSDTISQLQDEVDAMQKIHVLRYPGEDCDGSRPLCWWTSTMASEQPKKMAGPSSSTKASIDTPTITTKSHLVHHQRNMTSTSSSVSPQAQLMEEAEPPQSGLPSRPIDVQLHHHSAAMISSIPALAEPVLLRRRFTDPGNYKGMREREAASTSSSQATSSAIASGTFALPLYIADVSVDASQGSQELNQQELQNHFFLSSFREPSSMAFVNTPAGSRARPGIHSADFAHSDQGSKDSYFDRPVKDKEENMRQMRERPGEMLGLMAAVSSSGADYTAVAAAINMQLPAVGLKQDTFIEGLVAEAEKQGLQVPSVCCSRYCSFFSVPCRTAQPSSLGMQMSSLITAHKRLPTSVSRPARTSSDMGLFSASHRGRGNRLLPISYDDKAGLLKKDNFDGWVAIDDSKAGYDVETGDWLGGRMAKSTSSDNRRGEILMENFRRCGTVVRKEGMEENHHRARGLKRHLSADEGQLLLGTSGAKIACPINEGGFRGSPGSRRNAHTLLSSSNPLPALAHSLLPRQAEYLPTLHKTGNRASPIATLGKCSESEAWPMPSSVSELHASKEHSGVEHAARRMEVNNKTKCKERKEHSTDLDLNLHL